MTKFYDLGVDLADIVCDFAFKCRYSEVFYSLKCVLSFPRTLVESAPVQPEIQASAAESARSV